MMYLSITFINQLTYPSTYAIHTSRNTSQKLQKSLSIFNAPQSTHLNTNFLLINSPLIKFYPNFDNNFVPDNFKVFRHKKNAQLPTNALINWRF